MARVGGALLIGLAVLFELVAASEVPLRGVSPELADKYKPDKKGKWKCLGNGEEIDFSQVNDNYCDCADSSDEPGTSACPHAIFYCANRGHRPKLITSAFVDDGVCDCCDGTDELRGCKNTCLQQNAEVREQLQKKVDDYKLALQRKKDILGKAPKQKTYMHQKLRVIDDQIKAQQDKVVKLNDEKSKAESEWDSERLQKEEEAKKKAAEEAAAVEAAAAAHDKAEEQRLQEEQQQQEQHPGESTKEETAEERGRRIASQWTHDPEAAGVAEEKGTASEDKPAVEGEKGWIGKAWDKIVGGDSAKDAAEGGAEEGEPSEGQEGEWEEPPQDDAEEQPPEWEEEGPPDREEAPPEGEEEPQPVTPSTAEAKVQAIREQHRQANEELEQLQSEKQRLTRQMPYANDPLLGLADVCVEAREPQYTYRGCLFDKAAQVDNNAGHETNLGTWKGFNDDMTEAVFDQGDVCANAPQRSFTLKVECGSETKAWGGSEPSTCKYLANMSSPVACKESGLKELQDELARLLAEEALIAKEIAEAEKAREAAERAREAAEESVKDEL